MYSSHERLPLREDPEDSAVPYLYHGSIVFAVMEASSSRTKTRRTTFEREIPTRNGPSSVRVERMLGATAWLLTAFPLNSIQLRDFPYTLVTDGYVQSCNRPNPKPSTRVYHDNTISQASLERRVYCICRNTFIYYRTLHTYNNIHGMICISTLVSSRLERANVMR